MMSGSTLAVGLLVALYLGACVGAGAPIDSRGPDVEDGKDEGEGESSRGVPQTLPLRNPTSLHKRLYPRWYQAYVYKAPTFNRVAGPFSSNKRFQPFHPLARFRGLSATGGYSSGYRGYDIPLADHPIPSAPNVQTSLPYDNALAADEELLEDDPKLKAGDILALLKDLANDRGLSGHIKNFRYGISRRK